MINQKPGGKNPYTMRDGWFISTSTGDRRAQTMHFAVSDIVHVKISAGDTLSTPARGPYKAARDHESGEIVDENSELLGVAKGVRQLLLERGVPFLQRACVKEKYKTKATAERKEAKEQWKNDRMNYNLLLTLLGMDTADDVADTVAGMHCDCGTCVLMRQEDFRSQLGGLDEVYYLHNQQYGTHHKAVFNPKFHPEMNAIERAWSRMKWHVKKVNNGAANNLLDAMKYGLSRDNLSLATIRKYCRLVSCYYDAYHKGFDIVAAEKWIATHKHHRGYAKTMDEELESKYFPHGREKGSESPENAEENQIISEVELEGVFEQIDSLYPTL